MAAVLPKYSNFQFIEVRQGYYFGEVDLLKNYETRKYTFIAKHECDFFVLNKKNFKTIFLRMFRDVGAELVKNAIVRDARMRELHVQAIEKCKKPKRSIKRRKLLTSFFRENIDNFALEKALHSSLQEIRDSPDDLEQGASNGRKNEREGGGETGINRKIPGIMTFLKVPTPTIYEEKMEEEEETPINKWVKGEDTGSQLIRKMRRAESGLPFENENENKIEQLKKKVEEMNAIVLMLMEAMRRHLDKEENKKKSIHDSESQTDTKENKEGLDFEEEKENSSDSSSWSELESKEHSSRIIDKKETPESKKESSHSGKDKSASIDNADMSKEPSENEALKKEEEDEIRERKLLRKNKYTKNKSMHFTGDQFLERPSKKKEKRRGSENLMANHRSHDRPGPDLFFLKSFKKGKESIENRKLMEMENPMYEQNEQFKLRILASGRRKNVFFASSSEKIIIRPKGPSLESFRNKEISEANLDLDTAKNKDAKEDSPHEVFAQEQPKQPEEMESPRIYSNEKKDQSDSPIREYSFDAKSERKIEEEFKSPSIGNSPGRTSEDCYRATNFELTGRESESDEIEYKNDSNKEDYVKRPKDKDESHVNEELSGQLFVESQSDLETGEKRKKESKDRDVSLKMETAPDFSSQERTSDEYRNPRKKDVKVRFETKPFYFLNPEKEEEEKEKEDSGKLEKY